jgi:hypothetical protein
MGEPSETVENPVPETSEEADALFNSVMEPNVETSEPTEGETESKGEEPSKTEVNDQKPENTDDLFTLKHKEFEEGERQFSRDKVTEYAQKGFDYELKMHQLKTERAAFEEKMQELEKGQTEFSQKREYWENIDKYMEENPAFADTVRQAWDAQQGQNSQTTMSPEYQALQSTINQLQERLNAQDKETQEHSHKQAEESLIKSKTDYQKEHPDFDWDAKDEFGQTLQERIEKHAVDNGIQSYTLAGNSYLFEQHMKRAEMKAKESAAKELLDQKKKGLGPVTDHSIKQTQQASALGAMTYQDLAKEALKEMGIDD